MSVIRASGNEKKENQYVEHLLWGKHIWCSIYVAYRKVFYLLDFSSQVNFTCEALLALAKLSIVQSNWEVHVPEDLVLFSYQFPDTSDVPDRIDPI